MSDKPTPESPDPADPTEASSQATAEGSSSAEGSSFDLGMVIAEAKKVIFDPIGFYQTMPTSGGFTNPVIFVAVMALMTAAIGFILSFIGLATFNAIVGGAVSLGMLILVPIMAVIASFIGAAVMFVIWKLMGSERNYETAYRCVAFSFAIAPVVAVISLIPYLANLIKALWGGFLIYTASIEVHKIKSQTAMIVVGILTALNVFIGFGSERTARHWQDKLEGYEEAAEELERKFSEGSIGDSIEKMEDMTPEEAGKQVGELLKSLEKFSEGLEESVKEAEQN